MVTKCFQYSYVPYFSIFFSAHKKYKESLKSTLYQSFFKKPLQYPDLETS